MSYNFLFILFKTAIGSFIIWSRTFHIYLPLWAFLRPMYIHCDISVQKMFFFNGSVYSVKELIKVLDVVPWDLDSMKNSVY